MSEQPVTPTSPTPAVTSSADPALATPASPTSMIGGPLPDTAAPAAAPAVDPAAPAAPEASVAEFVPLTFDTLAVPKGLQIKEGDKLLPEAEQLLGILNEAKMPPEKASALLALHEQFLQKAADQYLAVWEKTQTEWRKGVETLPEFGGAALPETLSQIAKIVDRYGDAEVREAFVITGAGNHPAVVRFMAKIAKDMNEAPPTKGTHQTQTADRASRMYNT